MSLKDEITAIRNQTHHYYSDEEVYDRLLKQMYSFSRGGVLGFFNDNPNANEYTWDWRLYDQGLSIHRKNASAEFRNDSYVYSLRYDSDLDTLDIHFRELFCFERKGSFGKNKIIYLTPLGERVIGGLRALAAKDGIVLKEVMGEYYCRYMNAFGNHADYRTKVKLNERFSGKDPDSKFTGSSANIIVTFYYRLG